MSKLTKKDMIDLAMVMEQFFEERDAADASALFIVVEDAKIEDGVSTGNQMYMSSIPVALAIPLLRHQADRLEEGRASEIELLSTSKPKGGADRSN